jgi:hypothetical protein
LTSSTPTTSTTEETPPAAGRELYYKPDYLQRSGIQ